MHVGHDSYSSIYVDVISQYVKYVIQTQINRKKFPERATTITFEQ